MDFDNDGIQDFISGSYDPGDLYLFRGQGDGKYAAVEKILDKSGLALVHHPKEFKEWSELDEANRKSGNRDSITLRVATFGSWPATVDWDNDGDLDVLIGTFEGNLFLRLNEGTRSEPSYDPEAIPVEADNKPIHVNMHAAPVVADWDADGLWDLVVGSGDGGVCWFRNTGTAEQPRLAAAQLLVAPASDSKFFEQNLQPGEVPTHGTRAQICVTDYNGDGKLDLILGDYSDINWLRELTDDEKAEQAKLVEKRKTMIDTAWKLRKQFAEDDENEEFQKEMEQYSEVYRRLEVKRKAFFQESRRASFVWLFLRQEANEPTAAAPANPDPPPPSAEQTAPDDHDSKTDQLTLTTSVDPVKGASDEFMVSVEISIKPGWHLYSDVPEGGAHRATTVELKLPAEVTAEGEWERAPGFPALDNPAEKIYTGLARFSRTVKYGGSEERKIEVVVDYEVCNEDYCLPVSTLKRSVTIEP